MVFRKERGMEVTERSVACSVGVLMRIRVGQTSVLQIR